MSDAYGHRWLSEAVEDLVSEVATMPSHQPHCDVLVVGSGYGGAVAAARLAGARPEGGGDPIKVWLLERGNEMLPGMFPANFAELPGHVRFSMQDGAAAHGRAEGLFTCGSVATRVRSSATGWVADR
jgi:choline dehydrogenase-like flavoprotein